MDNAHLQAYTIYVSIASMNNQEPKNTVNIRVFRDTRDRLKVKAARKKVSIMQHVDDISRVNRRDEFPDESLATQ